MNIGDISLIQLESMLKSFEERREQIRQFKYTPIMELERVMENNNEESILLHQWFSELLAIFDRNQGNDDNTAKEWINANWIVSIASGRYEINGSATEALQQFVTNRYNIDSIHRIGLGYETQTPSK